MPSGKRYQSKHVHQLLEIFWAGSAFGVRPADDILLLWKGGGNRLLIVIIQQKVKKSIDQKEKD
ncbi:hypothetical protein HMPREF7545_0045 [Selenomonas noxia ATCC 43541]|nr:hypothetical protein HMPREF7545_0045 [Selenomonas noxia ATCC 43541]